MSNRFAQVLIACAMAAAGGAQAQELRCTQVFMNASEKRICASPELLQLDQQMGELGRRVEPHQDSLKKDQRRFRKALKTCNGDEACLNASYQNRITELQAAIRMLPLPTAEEIAALDEGAAKAEEKREAQSDTRERIAERLANRDAETLPPLAAPEVFQAPEPEFIAAVESAPVEPVYEVPAPQGLSNKDKMIAWGILALIVIFAIWIVASIRTWAHRVFKRCPDCKKWNAGSVLDTASNSYTDYETRTFDDVHKDRDGMTTGRTSKTRQVAVRVTDRLDHLQCKFCSEKWTIAYQTRSS